MYSQMFQVTSYHVNFYAMPIFILAFGVFFFGLFSLLRERFSPLSLSLFLLTFCVSLWLFCLSFVYRANMVEVALLWSNLAYIFLSLVAPSSYLFLCLFLGLHKKRAPFICIGFLIAAGVIFCQLQYQMLFGSAYHYFWGYYPRFNVVGSIPFMLFFWGSIGVCLAELFNQYVHVKPGSQKYYQLRLLIFAGLLAFLGIVDTFANYGIGVYPFGYMGLLGILVVIMSLSKKVDIFDLDSAHSSYHLLNAMNDAMILCDEQGVVRLANERAKQMIGGNVAEMVGKPIQEIISNSAADAKTILAEMTQRQSFYDFETNFLGKDGSVIPVRLSYSPILDLENDRKFGWAIMAQNITEQKEMEQKLTRSITQDQLTGLYNRKKFEEELAKHLDSAKKTKIHGALLLIDLDRFKEINDSFGHSAGDKILSGMASILKNNFRKVDILARLGADEFGVITPNVKLDDIKFIVSKLLSVIGRSRVQIENHEISLSVSVGVALFPLHADTSDTLLAYADYALYKSKKESRNSFTVYSSSKNWTSPFKMQITWATRIRHALQNNRFVLLAQPIYNAQTNKTSHYELLLRMRGDDEKLISPDSFIHVAAHYGLIRDINYWVVEQVFLLAKKFPTAHFTCNLSGGIFSDDKLLSVLDDRISNSGVKPERITIEITENVIMSDIKNAMRCLNIFKKKGLKFALDDFGTGLSSFAYLKGLPIDFLKIDGSFVKNLQISELDKDFVQAMVQIARRLGVKTIAEYVENQEIVDILKSVGVDYFQGYHFSKPLDVAEAVSQHPSA